VTLKLLLFISLLTGRPYASLILIQQLLRRYRSPAAACLIC